MVDPATILIISQIPGLVFQFRLGRGSSMKSGLAEVAVSREVFRQADGTYRLALSSTTVANILEGIRS
jgi:hypothetical protein